MWDHLPLDALQPDPVCEECMGRYANIIHAQRKTYVDKRLAELALEDPEHYYAGEWDALYDAKIELHTQPRPVA
jgi:hypothetical protein